MREPTAEAVKILKRTHAEGCELFQGTAYKPESFEIALEVERHRWNWKPEKPKLVLVAESHVFTTSEEWKLRLNESKIKMFLRRNSTLPPSQFVRLVYCLAYGESDLLDLRKSEISNYGTTPYWDIFGRITFRSPQPREEDGARFPDRMKWKVETLRELYRMGIWLLDASVHAIYLRNRNRLSENIKQKLHDQWWKGYGGFLIKHCNFPKIWVIGKTVYNCLAKSENWSCNGWVYQPNASNVYLNRNWPKLLEECKKLRRLNNN